MNLDKLHFPESGEWLNTEKKLSAETLKGHVVLLDFWTYCCINCMHVLEDLHWLQCHFRDKPFVIVGVHSAKYPNERIHANIESAIVRYGISHPVFVDSEFKMWDMYRIKAWPSFALFGADGILYSKTSGEGKRGHLNKKIHEALDAASDNGSLAKGRVHIATKCYHARTDNTLAFPGKLAVNKENGHLFVSDSNNNRILHVDPFDHEYARVIDVIGSGNPGNEDGSFATASFNKPQGIASENGLLFVADTGNHLIRMIHLRERNVRIIAGTGEIGYSRSYSGPATRALLNSPWDIASDGEALYIAMAGLHQIWRLDMETREMIVAAGNGYESIVDGPSAAASLAQPSGISICGDRAYFVDSETSSLRYLDIRKGDAHTLIGTGLFDYGDTVGPFVRTLLQHPVGLHALQDRVYLADTYNHAIKVAELSGRRVRTIVRSTGDRLFNTAGKQLSELPLFEPNDVLCHNGVLYIADTNNHVIRKLESNATKLITLNIMT